MKITKKKAYEFFAAGSNRPNITLKAICVTIVLFLLITAGGGTISAASSAEYQDDFESGSQNWDLGDGWQLKEIDGNTVLEGKGHTWATLKRGGWDYYAFVAKFKIIDGTIHFNYRRSVDTDGANRYFVGVSSTELYMEKQDGNDFSSLSTARPDLDGGWHEIEIKAYQGLINVSIDGVLYIAYKDNDYFASGGVAFETLDDSDFLLDDIRIFQVTADDVAEAPEKEQADEVVPDETHAGDLVLSGTQQMVIEDECYLQQGNIYIKDNAKLTVRNSQLVIGRGDSPTIHVYINVDDNASLEIDGTEIYAETVSDGEMGALVCVRNSGTITMSDSPTEIHLFENYEGGKFTMDNSEMVNPIGGLLQVEGGDIKITNSTLGALGLTLPAGAECSLSNLKSGAYLESWDVHDFIPKAGYSLVLEKTTLLKDDLEPGPYERGWLFFPDPDSSLELADSEVRKVFIGLNGETASFDNLRIDMPSSLTYRNIRLKDIVMRGQWPFTIKDSNVTISRSNYLFLQPSGNSGITLTNSHVVEFIPREFSGTIHYESCTWTNAGEIIGGESYHSMSNNFTMTGSLKIAPELREHLQWSNATVTREFETDFIGSGGNPIPSLTVKIGGETYTTDDGGKITFNLVFDEDNYNKPERLEVFDGDQLVFQKDIDFFTETPVIFAEAVTAVHTDSSVMVNGNAVAFEAYNIGGNNYFKLRDVAKALNGSARQFEVEWDADSDAVRVSSGSSYTSVGGELEVSTGSEKKSAALTTSSVYIDGVPEKLTAYNINGNNYFKLRDVAAALDFGVTWDGTTSTIGIDTMTG